MSFHERNEKTIQTKVKLVKIWSVLMGLVNLLVGILLLACPAAFAAILGLAPAAPDVPALLSGVGVLVGGMGLSYFVVLWPFKGGRIVWYVTSLLYGMTSAAIVWTLEMDCLPANCLLVALLGFLLALVQVAVLRAGWWTTIIKWQNYRASQVRGGRPLTWPI